MLSPSRIILILPAYNEEASLPLVLRDVPHGMVTEVVVVDNASTDRTADVAREAGATVVFCVDRGYGNACLAGLAYARTQCPDVVAFLDADYSDYPEELTDVLTPILHGQADFVCGSRMIRPEARRALLPQARFGNQLACTLMRWRWGTAWTDLGPFRAIRWETLERLQMQDPTFGWTIEMQIKAAREGVRVAEVPVSYRKRVGVSKITGTLSGTARASVKILWTLARYGLLPGVVSSSRGSAGPR